MSDWLERELTRGLPPLTAPDALKIRLGLAPAPRRELPRGVLAVAAAVVMIIGGGYAAGRSSALDLRQNSARSLRFPKNVELVAFNPASPHAPGQPWPLRCDGGASASLSASSPLSIGNATVWLAHSASEPHSQALSNLDAGCHQCHSL